MCSFGATNMEGSSLGLMSHVEHNLLSSETKKKIQDGERMVQLWFHMG